MNDAMEQNPYESPKEIETAPRKARGLFAMVFGTVALIPAGCICGGLTCYSTGVSVEIVSGNGNPSLREAGWLWGIPLGLLVMGFIWYVYGRQIWKRRP